MRFNSIISLAATCSLVAAQYKGFNYGSTLTDGTPKAESVFEAEFKAAKALVGTSGFSSARLYTMIQAGSTNDVISAIQAAINTDTTLLLGLWASGGQEGFTNEITALKKAITQFGTAFTSRVVGISVGSEDLYRISVTGISNMSGVGAGPDVIVNFINQLRQALAGTALSAAKITHVDTFDVWTNGTNAAVISAVDFISMDAYPYFQKTMANSIENGASLFESAYQQTVAVAQGKDVWVTETGWPVSGANFGQAVASTANSKTYWDEVGCGFLFGKINTYWYILQDAVPTLPSPSFGLVGVGPVSGNPVFDLTCPASGSALVAAGSSSISSSAGSSSSSSSTAGSSSSNSRSSSSSSSSTSSSSSSSSSSRSSSNTQAATSASARTSRPVVSTQSTTSRAATTAAQATTTGTTSASATSVPVSNSAAAKSLSMLFIVAAFFVTL